MQARERSHSIAARVSLALALTGVASAAHAGDPRAAAEVLFREGRKLLAEGQIDAACEKLEQSQRLGASGGTLMNLADCHEKQGKTASAWSEFVAAEALAREERRAARASEAKRRAAALLPRLSTLTIAVPHPVPGLEVRRNGALVPADQLGVAIPLDPGQHQVAASAPGYEPIAISVTLGGERDARSVSLPELKPVDAPPPAPPAPARAPDPAPLVPAPTPPLAPDPPLPRPEAERANTTTLGFVTAGAGVVLAGAGTVFYVLSLSTNDEAEAGCAVKAQFDCNKQAIEAEGRRDTYAAFATLGGVTGIAAIGAGAWLILSSPSPEPSSGKPAAKRRPELVPVAGVRGASLLVRGRF
jgi:hypothetical protein